MTRSTDYLRDSVVRSQLPRPVDTFHALAAEARREAMRLQRDRQRRLLAASSVRSGSEQNIAMI